jgi:hypothetical protein
MTTAGVAEIAAQTGTLRREITMLQSLFRSHAPSPKPNACSCGIGTGELDTGNSPCHVLAASGGVAMAPM